MLCQFSFENFKSFKDEATLDFFAADINEHKNTLIIDKKYNKKFLPVIALYGPNGGGKSTVLEALSFLHFIVTHKIILDIEEIPTNYDFIKNKYHTFEEKCKTAPSKFELLFRTKKHIFKYEISLIISEGNRIIEENLYGQQISEEEVKVIFERNQKGINLGEDLKGVAIGAKLKDTMPALSQIYLGYNLEIIDEIILWFSNIQFFNYNNPNFEKIVALPSSQKIQEKILKTMQNMDINISTLNIKKDKEGTIEEISFKYILPNGNQGEILFDEESEGTKKIFSGLGKILQSLEEGAFVMADELDAKLHPKLLRYIIELFKNKKINKNGAQLLLTSHDMTTMTADLLRRYEIYFCALSANHSSTLYSLVEFKSEKGKDPRNISFSDQYLEGRYGADPYLKNILDWRAK